MLGGQVIAEVDLVYTGLWQWVWARGYVYSGQGLLAVQQGGVFFVHEDPITKSKRVTNTSGALQSAEEVDPYGAEAGGYNTAFQPRKFTTYERDLIVTSGRRSPLIRITSRLPFYLLQTRGADLPRELVEVLPLEGDEGLLPLAGAGHERALEPPVGVQPHGVPFSSGV